MAFRDVDPPAPENAGNYYKFKAMGDRLAGVFLSAKMTTGKFGDKMEYKFKTAAGEVTFTPPTDAARKLEAAELQPGHKVIITWTGEKDIGKGMPMKLFRVQVDGEAKKPPAPAKPAPEPGSDFDFPE